MVVDAVDRLLMEGDSSLLAITTKEVQSLLGLLVHLRVVAQNRRLATPKSLWRILRHLGPADRIPRARITPERRERLQFWRDLVTSCPAVAFSVAFDRAAPVIDGGAKVRFVMYTDAAKDGTDHPALGGFLDGLYFALRLQHDDVVGPLAIPIAPLEFATWGVAVLTYERYVSGHPVALFSDSLTSTDAIANDSHTSELMQYIAHRLFELPSFRALCATGLTVGHLYGEANPLADAPSRGKFALLHELCAQMGIPARRLEVPQQARDFFADIRRFHRERLGARSPA